MGFLMGKSVSANYRGIQKNPADEITNLINANRASTKLAKLRNNAGLGCIALQFLSQCARNCSSNGTLSCQPPAANITEVYAPNCGVELPTVGVISGYLLGCHWSRVSADQAFSDVLRRNEKAASLVHGKDLTELGAGFMKEKHGAFYWCILFSNEISNSSFVLEQGGRGIEQKFGCFSGSDAPCSAGKKLVVLGGSLMKVLLSILQASFLLWC
ncbi:hypothetical protein KSP40_PGU016994 [Platanthera guangdongensis]|uniref:Uncharacterized protein n=1 Tax=Platanthera guangdongensis TaxID=2320717 RepID=A0ABR2MYA4_9ASPA